MSNLHSQQFPSLYHGTIETLPEGGIIKPRDAHDVAWATSRLDYALKHAQERTISGYGERSGGEYPVHHGNVYEVEPLDDVQSNMMHSDKDAVYSKTGFKVKKHVASVLGPEDNRETLKKHYPSFDPSQESYLKDGRSRTPEA